MDALILSVGTGGGHNAAGRAIEEELRRRGDSVRFFNPYQLASPELEKSIDMAYIRLAVNVPQAFGTVYRIGNAYRQLPFRSPVFHANRTMAPVLASYLEKNPADVIFMPHLYPAEIISQMKALGLQIPKTIFVSTDYTCIPFTEETDCDAYVIPSLDLKNEYLSRGIPDEKIHSLGIPVSASFSEPLSREEACAELGLDPEQKYLLILGGSIGAGAVEDTLSILTPLEKEQKFHPIVICGSNEKLYEKIRSRFSEGYTLIQHTDQVAAYMSASSIVIGKPGGLSSTETAVLGRPLIHTEPIPGCETRNRNYFSSRGMCLPVSDLDSDLAGAVQTLSDEFTASAMIRSQAFWIPKNAARDICLLADSLIHH